MWGISRENIPLPSLITVLLFGLPYITYVLIGLDLYFLLLQEELDDCLFTCRGNHHNIEPEYPNTLSRSHQSQPKQESSLIVGDDHSKMTDDIVQIDTMGSCLFVKRNSVSETQPSITCSDTARTVLPRNNDPPFADSMPSSSSKLHTDNLNYLSKFKCCDCRSNTDTRYNQLTQTATLNKHTTDKNTQTEEYKCPKPTMVHQSMQTLDSTKVLKSVCAQTDNISCESQSIQTDVDVTLDDWSQTDISGACGLYTKMDDMSVCISECNILQGPGTVNECVSDSDTLGGSLDSFQSLSSFSNET